MIVHQKSLPSLKFIHRLPWYSNKGNRHKGNRLKVFCDEPDHKSSVISKVQLYLYVCTYYVAGHVVGVTYKCAVLLANSQVQLMP